MKDEEQKPQQLKVEPVNLPAAAPAPEPAATKPQANDAPRQQQNEVQPAANNANAKVIDKTDKEAEQQEVRKISIS